MNKICYWLICLSIACFMFNYVETRCGYPDLPYLAQMFDNYQQNEVLNNWNYFEENQFLKVVCQKGPIGFLKSNNITKHRIMSIDSHTYIQCRNNQWDMSDLFCLQTIESDKFTVTSIHKVNQSSTQDFISNEINLLFNPNGNENISCVNIGRNNTFHGQNISINVQFKNILNKPSRRTIPRIVLIVRNLKKIQNISMLENLILNNSSIGNSIIYIKNSEENIEIEENKRFLDFIHWFELFNESRHDHVGGYDILVPLFNEIKSGELKQQKMKEEHTIETSFGSLILSVQIANTVSQNDTDWRLCYFNEDVAINAINFSTEFLVFDCPLAKFPFEDKIDFFRINIKVQNENNGPPQKTGDLIEAMHLCGLQVFVVSNDQCGQPSIPINGLVTRIEHPNGKKVSQYSCISGYQITNIKTEMKTGLYISDQNATETSKVSIMERYCDAENNKWLPDFTDVFCVPEFWCRTPPPLPNSSKFLFEYSKLDNMNRAVANSSLATLRCIMVTHNVIPFTAYRCGKDGKWIRINGLSPNSTELEPECVPSKYRERGRFRGYRRYYYHYYPIQSSSNMNTLVWGHHLSNNKYLTYYGGTGIAILFLASFVILIHVRRMAKKMSSQMREQIYMNMDKSGTDTFMQISDGQIDRGNPPDYYSESNFFDSNTLYSNDLPPPATPISMPTTLNYPVRCKTKNDLNTNLNPIKF